MLPANSHYRKEGSTLLGKLMAEGILSELAR